MTRLFLAAGVAALAITAPAIAGPGGGHEKGGGNTAAAVAGGGHGNGGHGGGGGAPAVAGGGGGGPGHGGGGAAPVFAGGGGGGRGHGGGFAAPEVQRVERQQTRGFERQQARDSERQQARGLERQQARGFGRQQARAVERQRGFEGRQARSVERQQAQARGIERQQARLAERQQPKPNGVEQSNGFQRVQRQVVVNNVVNAERGAAFRNAQTVFAGNRAHGLIDGCPPGLWMKNNGCMPPGQAAKLLGTPLSAASAIVPLSVLPQSLSYLYPDTADYYYRYGDGYLYQVNRETSLISSLLPLIGGGYAPGQYLPANYMSSYVPDYYGLNSFYPDTPYGCNRYYNGVIYQVDCATGYVENVVPTYAGGYGVGQLLPSAYNYYNVPTQYRSLYYDTPDTGYWYAPGAIYQYDQGSSMITSVASLLSPGFSIGQPLPVGYDAYNVPYDYRQTYYDTPDARYRYNNGYIYQVDPTTQLVTAIVASLLT